MNEKVISKLKELQTSGFWTFKRNMVEQFKLNIKTESII